MVFTWILWRFTKETARLILWNYTPKMNGWNLRIHPWKRKIIFQTITASGAMLIFGAVRWIFLFGQNNEKKRRTETSQMTHFHGGSYWELWDPIQDTPDPVDTPGTLAWDPHIKVGMASDGLGSPSEEFWRNGDRKAWCPSWLALWCFKHRTIQFAASMFWRKKNSKNQAGPMNPVNKNILLDSKQQSCFHNTWLAFLKTRDFYQSSRRWCQVARYRTRYHSPTARMHSCSTCFRLQQPWACCGWCPGGKTSKKRTSRWELALGSPTLDIHR